MVVPVGTASRGLAGQVLKLLPAQLLALATAERTGQNPDAPRNLAKVVLL
jgi:glucosamine 6-phosphate synthetase-like amidotransferase/phosphosugar isomerase protein